MIAAAPEVPGAEPARTFEEAKQMLGWRDELVYHRQRTDHREDMFHTVGHLAAGVMPCDERHSAA